MITTSPDGQWAVVRRGREVSLLANGAGPATSRLELPTEDADLVIVGPPSVLAIVAREPAEDGGEARGVVLLHQPPYLEPVARLELEVPMRLAAVTGARLVLVSLDGKAATIVRVAGRALSPQSLMPGSPIEFAVGLERNQVLFGLWRKLEAWDAVSCRPLLRMHLQLPPPPRTIGPAHGHLWSVRPGGEDVMLCRLSDGRPFQHSVGAPIDEVISHPASPLLILATARGLVRLHCFAHSLTAIDAPWQPGTSLAQLVIGDDISLLGIAADADEPWRVPIGGAGAPAIAPVALDSPIEPTETAADKLRAMRERSVPSTGDAGDAAARDLDRRGEPAAPAADALDASWPPRRDRSAEPAGASLEAADGPSPRSRELGGPRDHSAEPADTGRGLRGRLGDPAGLGGLGGLRARTAEPADAGEPRATPPERTGLAGLRSRTAAPTPDGELNATPPERTGLRSRNVEPTDAGEPDTAPPQRVGLAGRRSHVEPAADGELRATPPERAGIIGLRSRSEPTDAEEPRTAPPERIGLAGSGSRNVEPTADGEPETAPLQRVGLAGLRSRAIVPNGERALAATRVALNGGAQATTAPATLQAALRSEPSGREPHEQDVGARDWREPLAEFAAALVGGEPCAVPAVAAETELGQLADRLGLPAGARRALAVLYGLYLVAAPAWSIAQLASALGDWTEALGRGELAALAMLRRRSGQVALRGAVTDVLDGLAPRAIRVVGGSAPAPSPGLLQLARDGRSDATIEAELVAQLDRIAVIEGPIARAVLEARLYGATAVAFAAPRSRPAPWPRDSRLVVIAAPDAPAWVAALPSLEAPR